MTDEQRKTILRLARKGMDPVRISVEVGKSADSVRKFLRRRKVKAKRAPRPGPLAGAMPRLRGLVKSLGASRVAARFRVSRQAVYARLEGIEE